MIRTVLLALLILPIVGCQTARPTHKMKFGPPPPGYIKIVGNPVPDWQPADMIAGPRGGSTVLNWYPIGPRPILNEVWSGNNDASGRVVSIAPHPTDPNTVYIASASGGVWKTIDGGAIWFPLTDELAILNHGCVALDPANPDTVYVGTGEYTTLSKGAGLFRSTDGGATWQQIANTAQVGTQCSGIIVDPTFPQRVHVAGRGGYHRTDDSGTTWNTFLSGDVSSLAINPLNPATLFAGVHGVGLFRSLDSGTTWTQLTNGLPGAGISRILIAVAPSNPNTVYTAIIDGSNLNGLFQSTDGGNTWAIKPNTPNFPSPQAWYDAFIGVDPTNENTLYAGGVFPSYAVAGVIKSTDAGNSWTDITIDSFGGQLHPDQHTVAFGPSGTLWIGNDGGVWKSNNGGTAWINTNATLAVTQNYNIALHPTDPAKIMGGTQDNGTIGRETDVDQWPQVIGGDGGFLEFDFNNPIRKYSTYVYLSIFRFDPGFADITGPWGSDPANFIAPLVMDPNDPHTLLGGTNRVWRTQDAHAAANWTAISNTAVAGGGTLNAIAVATGAPDTIYSGSSTGQVHVTTDAANWSNRSTGLPGGSISDILVNPNFPGNAYVSYHNTTGPRILRTINFGFSWTDVTGDMPQGAASNAIEVDWRFNPPHLYSGSGSGIYTSTDGGAIWVKDGLDLPNVNIGDLKISTLHNTITAGTYGRGAWRLDLPAACTLMGDVNESGNVNGLDIQSFIDCLFLGEAPGRNCTCAYPNETTAGAITLFTANLLSQ